MKSVSRRIVGSGLFALDVIVDASGTVSRSALGGSAGNVLSILGALGWQAAPVGSLGADFAGSKVCEEFHSVGADLRFMQRCLGQHTPVIYQHQLSSHEDGTHRFSFACPTCGHRRRPRWDDSFGEDWHALPKANVFFLDRPTRLGVELARHYRRSGALVVFEPSAVGEDAALFSDALRTAHIVKYADDRMSDLCDFEDSELLVEIQTLGSRGLRFRSRSLDARWMSLGAYELPRLWDTAGAGDWCTAGMIYILLEDGQPNQRGIDYNSLTRALAFGQVLSTLNCLTEGARGLLAAWSPEKIIRTGRQLSASRLRQFQSQNIAPSDCLREPSIFEFAHDSRFGREALLRVDSFACCRPLF